MARRISRHRPGTGQTPCHETSLSKDTGDCWAHSSEGHCGHRCLGDATQGCCRCPPPGCIICCPVFSGHQLLVQIRRGSTGLATSGSHANGLVIRGSERVLGTSGFCRGRRALLGGKFSKYRKGIWMGGGSIQEDKRSSLCLLMTPLCGSQQDRTMAAQTPRSRRTWWTPEGR